MQVKLSNICFHRDVMGEHVIKNVTFHYILQLCAKKYT